MYCNDRDLANMEEEKHVAEPSKSSKQGNLALEPEKQNRFKKNNKKIKSKSKEITEKGSGVVYLGHLPHGFYEEQIKKYMSQFGKVKAVKVSRSIKTGKSKGYAFVQFHSDEVAKVVADTMDNYLVFERLVKCQYIPSSKLHPKTMGRRSGVFKPPKAHIVAKDRHNNVKKELKQEKTIRRLLKKHKKKSELLKSLGVDLKMNKLESALSAGKKILEEKEKERAAKSKSESEVEATSPQKPVKETKTPLSARKLKKAESKSADKGETTKTPRAQATPVATPKAKKRKGTPAGSKAAGASETPKATSATTPAKAKGTAVHKVTPIVQKKKAKISESFNSSRDQSMEVLVEDSEEEEISFKTPPRSIRSSKTPTLSASVAAKKKRTMSAKKSIPTPAGRPQKKKRRSV